MNCSIVTIFSSENVSALLLLRCENMSVLDLVKLDLQIIFQCAYNCQIFSVLRFFGDFAQDILIFNSATTEPNNLRQYHQDGDKAAYFWLINAFSVFQNSFTSSEISKLVVFRPVCIDGERRTRYNEGTILPF